MPKALLKQGLTEMGFEVTDETIDRFMRYKDLLVEKNKVMNLTAITDERDIVIQHFLDSASCLTVKEIPSGSRIIDIGSGAGFPSVPIKLLRPDLHLTLLDSLQKRVRFLEELCERLQLDRIEFVHARAEDAARDPKHREAYDFVVSRAVASLPVLLEYSIPFLKPQAILLCMKGPKLQEELNLSKNALSALKSKVEEIRTVDVPFSDRTHRILIVQKTAATPKKYPRKSGVASKNPL